MNGPSSNLRIQFLWIIGGRIVAATLQALLIVGVARALGPRDFGVLMAVTGILVISQAIFDLGLSKHIIVERSISPDSLELLNSLKLNSIGSIALLIVAAASLTVTGALAFPVLLFMIPLALSVALEKNADVWMGIAIADGDTFSHSINLVGRRAAALIVFLTLSQTPLDSVLAYSSALAFGAVLSVLFARRYVQSRVSPLNASTHPFRSIRHSYPYWLNTVSSQMRHLDVFITTSLAGPVQAGYYATAARLTSPLSMFAASLAVVVLPHSARTRERSIKHALGRILGLAGVLCAGYGVLYLVTPTVVPLILGHDYGVATGPIRIVLIGLCISAFSTLLVPLLQGRGFQHFIGFNAAVSALGTLVLITILSPSFGAVGAAFGFIIGHAIELMGLSVFLTCFYLRRGTR